MAARSRRFVPPRAVSVPAGATRVDLAGKTVMPMMVDTHVHLAPTRDGVVRDLKRRAYFGVSTVIEHGPGQLRIARPPQGDDPGRRAIPERRARHHHAGARAHHRAILDPERRRTRARRCGSWPKRKSISSRSGSTPATANTRSCRANSTAPSSTRRINADLRVAAHIFDLEDAKGLLRAGLDAFAHGVRDKDIDDEFIATVKRHQHLILTPNLPDRGVKTDLSWLKPGLPAAEFEKLEAANTDRPAAQAFFGIQARNLAKMHAAGVRITMGTDGNRPWGAHEEIADMVAAGMTPMQVIVAATRNSARLRAGRGHRHAGSRQERRLHRARRQSARRHHQYAQDLGGLSARRGGGPSSQAP